MRDTHLTMHVREEESISLGPRGQFHVMNLFARARRRTKVEIGQVLEKSSHCMRQVFALYLV